MDVIPPIRYARSGSVSIAYQVLGSGPVEIVTIPPFAQNIELMWERPEFREILDRVSRFARLVHFDKRGTGMSDRSARIPTLSERVDDLRAVMDAAGVSRAILHGISEGGPMAILFAVSDPERVQGLVLHATTARFARTLTDPEVAAARSAIRRKWIDCWGTDDSITLALMAPTGLADEGWRTWWPRYERHAATPSAVEALSDELQTMDVRHLLDRVNCPTLVIHRSGDPVVDAADAEELAERIPGARLAMFEGIDHFPQIGDVHDWLDELERFATGLEPTSRPTGRHRHRSIQVRTFGGFSVIRDGHQVKLSEWGSRRARLLCKRLAAAAGSPVPRDVLAELLWPDDDDITRLGARLSVQLSTVRRILGGGIQADRDAVRLDLDRVALDVAIFRDEIAGRRFESAIAIYRGEFLPEDVYDAWAEQPRERARSDYQEALRRLADEAVERGDHDRSCGLARRLLDADPYDVDAHERLCTALSASGRHGDAERAREIQHARVGDLGIES